MCSLVWLTVYVCPSLCIASTAVFSPAGGGALSDQGPELMASVLVTHTQVSTVSEHKAESFQLCLKRIFAFLLQIYFNLIKEYMENMKSRDKMNSLFLYHPNSVSIDYSILFHSYSMNVFCFHVVDIILDSYA